jgi:hypothetical protein
MNRISRNMAYAAASFAALAVPSSAGGPETKLVIETIEFTDPRTGDDKKMMVTATPGESCASQKYIDNLPFGGVDPVISGREYRGGILHANAYESFDKEVPFTCLSKATIGGRVVSPSFLAQFGQAGGELMNGAGNLAYGLNFKPDNFTVTANGGNNSNTNTAEGGTAVAKTGGINVQQGQTTDVKTGDINVQQGQTQGQEQKNGNRHYKESCHCYETSDAGPSAKFMDVMKATLNGTKPGSYEVALVDDIRRISVKTGYGTIKTPFGMKVGQKLALRLG